MFLVWDDAFNTGVEVIDHQHRRLVQLINALYGAKVNRDAEGVADVMEQLVEYTVGHFAYEEHLLEQHDLAGLEDHKAGHDRFRDRLQQFRERMLAGEDIADELLGELKLWLTRHIQSDDFAYVKTLPADAGGGKLRKMFSHLFD